MTQQEIEEAIKILKAASETITSLDPNFKIEMGCYNLDCTLDDIVQRLQAKSTEISEHEHDNKRET